MTYREQPGILLPFWDELTPVFTLSGQFVQFFCFYAFYVHG
jgi:hypothetical protein